MDGGVLKIREISVENVKGIDTKTFELDLHPNKPVFFVAPNGFGKTSIATAFNSINRERIQLKDEQRHQNDVNALPLIKIIDDIGNEYLADSETNTIADEFSICVINNQLKPKANTQNRGGYSTSSPSLIVEPIVFYKTIPSRCDFDYSFTEMKRQFGCSAGKLLINLSQSLFDPRFVGHIGDVKNDLECLFQTLNQRKIKSFLAEINKTRGTTTGIATIDIKTDLVNVPAINRIIEKFDYLLSETAINSNLVNVIQLGMLFNANKKDLKKITKYYDFIAVKNEINEMLGFFNCTWKNISAHCVEGKFLIDFPKANQISNGERDVLCFIGKLFEARLTLRKNNAILIIDEIFDYLDDANLIAVQYFLTKFIDHFKKNGKALFPIILTHLDPMFFNTYSFSTKNIVYLNRIRTFSNKYGINRLLKDRDNCKSTNVNAYKVISSNYLHFSLDNKDESQYLQSIGVDPLLQTPESFRCMAVQELDSYRTGDSYDPALVCCGLRIHIEREAYNQLPQQYHDEFLLILKTTDKLKFAVEKGAQIPEVYFLLSIIYNEAMHLDPQCQKLNPITYKLKNKVIHHMIKEVSTLH